jgi:hypothetical protein
MIIVGVSLTFQILEDLNVSHRRLWTITNSYQQSPTVTNSHKSSLTMIIMLAVRVHGDETA